MSPESEARQKETIEAPEGMVLIPEGSFLMGSDKYADERPVHEIYLDAYCIDIFPVTNGQYKEFCDAEGVAYPPEPSFPGKPNYFLECPDHPVVMLSWMEAHVYAKLCGKQLPTEAQWEKAARGGLEQKEWPWGNEFEPGSCNCIEEDIGHPNPKGKYPPNRFGIYDMGGNVLEWCHDFFDTNYYEFGPDRNPDGLENASYHCQRGGSWYFTADNARCAFRNRNHTRYTSNYLGFRCAKNLP